MDSRPRGYTIMASGGPLQLTKGTYIALIKKKPIAKVYNNNSTKIVKNQRISIPFSKNNLSIRPALPRK